MVDSPATAADARWMRLALQLAAQGEGLVEPNPMVGCVLVRDEQLIGQGYHARFGGPHAEVAALADCFDARDATAYVTLEPCCHYGKTPPCAEALLVAGVSRVVVALEDPFPRVAGGGLRTLRHAGIAVTTDVLREEAAELLAPYLKRVTTGRPWVIAKWAMSMDGRIATSTGQSQWITGPLARHQVHRLRGRMDGIAVGMGTVLADDPQLTVRTESGEAVRRVPGEGGLPSPPARVPVRLIFCRRRLPDLQSQLVQTAGEVPTWVIAGPGLPAADLARLADHDVEIWSAESAGPVEMIGEALQMLASESNAAGLPMTNLLVEGGGELLGNFAAGGHLDEVHLYLGPLVIGGRAAPGPVGDPGVTDLSDASRWRLLGHESFGEDVRLVYQRSRNSSLID